MFCYQCEETAKGTGCTVKGVCGKTPEVAALQDLLIYALKGISKYAHRARQFGLTDNDLDRFTLEALFTTVTNVNFDTQRMQGMLLKAGRYKELGKKLYMEGCEREGQQSEQFDGPAAWEPAATVDDLVSQGLAVSIEKRIADRGADLTGLEELLTYGLKGTGAYADHALILGQEDDEVYAFMHEALDALTRTDTTVEELLGLNLRCGEVNLKVMGMLDKANTDAYGDPVPTVVRTTPIKGKAILVSGHDLKDLEELLKQTEGKGINVYTHSEMLPANAYPGLNKYKHLAGNYGGAWHAQVKEFAAFPGSIVMTTNCIQKPTDDYIDRIFTCGLVAFPGVKHVENSDFTPAIEAALAQPGFGADAEEKTITIGFGHNAVLGVADRVVEAVKEGKIKHFFLIGGCDSRHEGRSYYTDFAAAVPDDCVILTLACGKYRINHLDYGDIGGIPRLLDMGQCNDAYSAIQVAVALAKAFDCGVNDLPLSLIITWYEQKAVCILLTLLSLGVKNIRLGPKLPAFVTPTALNVLVEKFNIMPITTVEQDMADILGQLDAV